MTRKRGDIKRKKGEGRNEGCNRIAYNIDQS